MLLLCLGFLLLFESFKHVFFVDIKDDVLNQYVAISKLSLICTLFVAFLLRLYYRLEYTNVNVLSQPFVDSCSFMLPKTMCMLFNIE